MLNNFSHESDKMNELKCWSLASLVKYLQVSLEPTLSGGTYLGLVTDKS